MYDCMIDLKLHFFLNKLYKYIVSIKFICYKLKYLIDFVLQYSNVYKLLYHLLYFKNKSN